MEQAAWDMGFFWGGMFGMAGLLSLEYALRVLFGG